MRYKFMDPVRNKQGTVNSYVRRIIHDIPFLAYRFQIEIELAQVLTETNLRHIESCEFVAKGCYYTKRFCRLISGLCRHMTISAVARHFDLRWETVKNIDKAYLQATLPALDPSQLVDIAC